MFGTLCYCLFAAEIEQFLDFWHPMLHRLSYSMICQQTENITKNLKSKTSLSVINCVSSGVSFFSPFFFSSAVWSSVLYFFG